MFFSCPICAGLSNDVVAIAFPSRRFLLFSDPNDRLTSRKRQETHQQFRWRSDKARGVKDDINLIIHWTWNINFSFLLSYSYPSIWLIANAPNTDSPHRTIIVHSWGGRGRERLNYFTPELWFMMMMRRCVLFFSCECSFMCVIRKAG